MIDYRRRLQPLTPRLLLAACLAVTAAARAHHAPDAFDLETIRVVRGTVVAFDWTSPHTETQLAVDSGDGDRVVWTFEGRPPSFLGRRGWHRRTLEPGDRVEISYYPLRDEGLRAAGLRAAGPGGLFIRAVLADGTVRVMIDTD